MPEINRNSYFHCELSLYLLFLFSLVCCTVNFSIRSASVRNDIIGSPIHIAFNNPQSIFYAIVCTVAVTIPIGFELLLDLFMKWRSSIDDSRERLFLILLISVPGILIFYFDEEDLPFIFSIFHSLQYIGCFGVVLSLCNKLVPHYFTPSKMIFVQFFFVLGGILSMYGFGKPLMSWPNVSVFFATPLSIGSFLYFILEWLLTLNIKLSFTSYDDIINLPINEITCLLYISCTLLTIIVIPGVAAATCLFDWQYFNLPIILIFIYSLVGFSILPGCVPGRVARYSYMVAERSVAREQASKRSALRYLSHEMRSPLNVICSGIAFVLQDLEHLNVGKELLENLNDVRHASESAVSLLDDFLDFEKMELGLFNVMQQYVSLSEIISTVIKPLGIISRQKGLPFVVSGAGCQEREGEVERGPLEGIELHIDAGKISQVCTRYT